MSVLVNFNKGILLSFVLSLMYVATYSQNLKPLSVAQNTNPAVTCQPIKYTVGYQWECANFQYSGLTYSIAGSVITIDVNFIGGAACAWITRTDSDTISLTNVPPGTYSVSVRGMLSGTNTATISGSPITVGHCCQTAASFNPNSNNFCDGDTVRFTNLSSFSTSQKWFKNGVQLDTTKNYSEYISGPGFHAYKLVVISSCGSDTLTKNVRVLADPELGKDTNLCLGNSHSLSIPKLWNTYKWSDNSTTSGITINTSGKYKVTVTAGTSCSREDSVNVNFVGPILKLANDTTICKSSTITVDAGTGIWNKVSWNTGESTAQISVNKAGVYVANVENSIGCKYFDAIEILFDKDSILSISGIDTICQGDSTEITLSNNFAKYKWSDNDTNSVKSIRTAGTYTVTATSNAGCSVQNSKTIVVNALPVIDIGSDTTLCNDSIWVVNAARPGLVEYRWQNSARDRRFEIKKAGRYSVVVTDTNGCMGTDTVVVTYKECIEEPKDTTSINNSSEILSGINVYPNPANQKLFVEVNSQISIESVRIVDLSGKTVLDENVSGLKHVELDIANLESGVFVLIIRDNNNQKHFPIIKE